MNLTAEMTKIQNEIDIWYNVTKNTFSESCKDAANKRNRLGNIGIPLMDELKSNFVYYTNNKNEKSYALIHCRGNQLLDYDKVKNVLGSDFKRITSEDLKLTFNLEYGLINPISFKNNKNILQVFDESVIVKYLPPFTMMTNASNFEKGIEFFPEQLIDNLNNVILEDIIQDFTHPKIEIHKIGILTGNSPESGIMLWESINFFIRKKLKENFLGDISFPKVNIESIPEMGLSMELELREIETKKAVLGGIKRLCKNGASLICLACNTTQYFEPEITNICNEYNAKFIPMNKSVESYLNKNEIQNFDFLGIKYVVDFNKWSSFKSLNKKYNINIPSLKNLNEINELAFEVKKNKISSKGINKLRHLINTSTKNMNVVIALTELSILLASQNNKKKSKKNYIDTLTILADTISEIYVKEIKKAYTIPKSK